jgi:hypothetical protein
MDPGTSSAESTDRECGGFRVLEESLVSLVLDTIERKQTQFTVYVPSANKGVLREG